MKLCSYIVRYDTGFAPNPFGGYCTLAHCVPNHRRVKLNPDDWIVGISDSTHGHKLIYAMKITEERMHLDDYFNDGRFQKKKTNINGTLKERCGDNIYHLSSSGKWRQIPNPYHDRSKIEQDTEYPYVYISKKFWYFGENTIDIPDTLNCLIKRYKVNHPPEVITEFAKWIESNPNIGRQGFPRDKKESSSCGGKLLACGIAKKISKGYADKNLA